MGLAAKVKNKHTRQRYTISTVSRESEPGALEEGGIVAEAAVYVGKPSVKAVMAGEKPFVIVLNTIHSERMPLEKFHAFVAKAIKEADFTSPAELYDFIANKVGLDARLEQIQSDMHQDQSIDIIFI